MSVWIKDIIAKPATLPVSLAILRVVLFLVTHSSLVLVLNFLIWLLIHLRQRRLQRQQIQENDEVKPKSTGLPVVVSLISALCALM